MDKLYIVIPAYNERDTLPTLIEEWYPIIEKTGRDSRLVIVNDGSRDDTYEIMKQYAQNRPQFIPLSKENGGHGAAVLYGYRYALDQEADYVFQTDADGQTCPEEFWGFWEEREHYDLLIGNRINRQDGISRVFVTKVLKTTLRLCFGVSITDANTPFRLMKSQPLRENMELVPENFNLSNVLLSVIYAKKKQAVKYLPITFRPRQGGVNSINLKKICKIGIHAIRDFRKINRALKNI